MAITYFERPLNHEVYSLESGLAIVQNGDTASVAIPIGQYIFLKNHSTLPNGGYHATTNIAVGTTISSSNVTADANGIANALSGAVSTLNGHVGNLSSLTTTEKSNLVAAVNEVKGYAKTNYDVALTAKVSTSTFEHSVVRVGNVVAGVISIVTTANTSDSQTMISGFPAPRRNPQLPVWAVSGTQAGKRILIDVYGNLQPWWCSGVPAGNYIIPICYIAS